MGGENLEERMGGDEQRGVVSGISCLHVCVCVCVGGSIGCVGLKSQILNQFFGL